MFVLEVGNFGHNREAVRGKLGSVLQKTKDFAEHARVFPLDSVKFFFHFVGDGIGIAVGKNKMLSYLVNKVVNG